MCGLKAHTTLHFSRFRTPQRRGLTEKVQQNGKILLHFAIFLPCPKGSPAAGRGERAAGAGRQGAPPSGEPAGASVAGRDSAARSGIPFHKALKGL